MATSDLASKAQSQFQDILMRQGHAITLTFMSGATDQQSGEQYFVSGTESAPIAILLTVRKPHEVFGEGVREGDVLAMYISGGITASPDDIISFGGSNYSVLQLEDKIMSGISVYKKLSIKKVVSNA